LKTEVKEKATPKIFSENLLPDKFLEEEGRNLVRQFYLTLKTAKLYDENNSNSIKQQQIFTESLERVSRKLGLIELKAKRGYLHLNEQRLKFDFEGYTSSKYLMEQFKKFNLEVIIWDENVEEKELKHLIYFLVNLDYDEEESFEKLAQSLEEKGCVHIHLKKGEPEPEDEQVRSENDKKKVAKKTFFKAISVVQEIFSSTAQNKSVNLAKVKRVVQCLVDQILEDENNLIELTAIKNFDNYTYVHSANVCVLALAFGLRLDFPKNKLTELGFSALFHDIGKVKLPQDLITKPSHFDEFDWKQMRKHPLLGAKTLLGKKELDQSSIRSMVVALEHHLNLDLSGYPALKEKREQNLFSRIVSICDAFDAMTSGRVYMREALSPDEALKRMLFQRGQVYDASLLKIFIQMMGAYPVGTVVLLDSNEIGIVVQPNPQDLSHPKIKVIADNNGKRIDLEIEDLTETDPKTGKFKKNVIKTIDPQKYSLDISTYLLR
jgi:HD-GYP domain-containing protein (c-di-GMP phosphodiesterase class II)